MGKWRLGDGEIEAMATEFKKWFGESHTLRIVHDEDFSFLVGSRIEHRSLVTMLNVAQPKVARAMLTHIRGIAAQEYAILHDRIKIRATPIKSMRFLGGAGMVNMLDEGRDMVTSQVRTTVIYTSALTTHEHAADFVMYEQAKFSFLHKNNFPDNLRAVSLIARAYVEETAAHYGADVDADRITEGMRLDSKDQEIVCISRDMVKDVLRQRTEGTRIDIRPYTSSLDAVLGTQHKLLAGD